MGHYKKKCCILSSCQLYFESQLYCICNHYSELWLSLPGRGCRLTTNGTLIMPIKPTFSDWPTFAVCLSTTSISKNYGVLSHIHVCVYWVSYECTLRVLWASSVSHMSVFWALSERHLSIISESSQPNLSFAVISALSPSLCTYS